MNLFLISTFNLFNDKNIDLININNKCTFFNTAKDKVKYYYFIYMPK